MLRSGKDEHRTFGNELQLCDLQRKLGLFLSRFTSGDLFAHLTRIRAVERLGERRADRLGLEIVREHVRPRDGLQNSPMPTCRAKQRDDQKDMAETNEHSASIITQRDSGRKKRRTRGITRMGWMTTPVVPRNFSQAQPNQCFVATKYKQLTDRQPRNQVLASPPMKAMNNAPAAQSVYQIAPRVMKIVLLLVCALLCSCSRTPAPQSNIGDDSKLISTDETRKVGMCCSIAIPRQRSFLNKAKVRFGNSASPPTA